MKIARVDMVQTMSKKKKLAPQKRKTVIVPVEDLGEGAEVAVSHLEGASLSYGAFKLDDRVTVTLQCRQTEEGLEQAYTAGARLVRKFMKRSRAKSERVFAQAVEDLKNG